MSEAVWVNILIIIFLLSFTAIFFLSAKGKGITTLVTVIIFSLLTGFLAARSLAGSSYEVILAGTSMFGDVPLRIDPLSAWFILVIDFTMLTGAFYGLTYMKIYSDRKNNITLHCIAYLLVHFSMVGVCAVQNSFIFLLLWEILALAVFILVIFESNKPDTVKAGIDYLVQSHLSIVFLMIAFIYYAFKTNSYSFDAIKNFSSGQSSPEGIALFLLFFAGFALKSGFIPFHTWLPYAHPAAPSHVSGVMSGVVIKIGIYGILRMLLLIKTDYTSIGFFILFISLFTGIYGVMLAIIQHNLKKLLAYHSIENIGIIGIGIGLGCIGLGTGNKWMAILGFTGGMLHTLNHSLFKSLLFFSAGNVYQSAHTMNIEHLGGLIKRMPKTAILFLVAAIAICGLPPLNGFVSEFLIFGGLYESLFSSDLVSLIAMVFALGGFVFIGGLAIFCFTKAFSVVFLGNSRKVPVDEVHERGFLQLFPMYLTVSLMIAIGLFPSLFIEMVQQPVSLFTHNSFFNLNLTNVKVIDSFRIINWLFIGFILFVLGLFGLRNYVNRKKETELAPTWGCGYNSGGSKLQYTAGSFAKSYSKLAGPLLEIEKKGSEIDKIFPSDHTYETDSYDKIERIFIDKPLKLINKITDLFTFLQNGQLQSYILYGIIFISAVICVPFLIRIVSMILLLLN